MVWGFGWQLLIFSTHGALTALVHNVETKIGPVDYSSGQLLHALYAKMA
jgi:hypothetical protein